MFNITRIALRRFTSPNILHKVNRSIGLPYIKRSLTSSSKVLVDKSSLNTASNVKAESRIKKLMKTYGYSALVVYIGVTLISLPLCFFTVHSLGAEKISIYLNKVKRIFGYGEAADEAVIEKIKEKKLEIEEQRKQGTPTRWQEFKQSTLLAEFLIAYGLHKSLIFVRIPLTAAVTPSMARLFKRWGFTRLVGGTNNLIKNNSNIFPKPGANGEFPRQNRTKSQKWFNGLM